MGGVGEGGRFRRSGLWACCRLDFHRIADYIGHKSHCGFNDFGVSSID